MGYSALLAKNNGSERSVITPWRPSWVFSLKAIVLDKNSNPIANNKINNKIPKTEKIVSINEKVLKNLTPKTYPKTNIIKVWINDFAIPLKLNPINMWERGSGEASISFINPNSLSNWRVIPLYKQVNRIVNDITPAAMNVK